MIGLNHPRPTRRRPQKKKVSKEKVSSYELSQLGTAFNVGESPLSLGVAVKIAD
jgi:hypothetical protein